MVPEMEAFSGDVRRLHTSQPALSTAGGHSVAADGRRPGNLQADDTTTLPRIVLRDPAGLPIDTFTSYQRDIAVSRQRLAAAKLLPQHVSIGPNEWRLPHAPVPARPDYSRNAPPGGGVTDRQRGQKLLSHDVSRSAATAKSQLLEALDVGSRQQDTIRLLRKRRVQDPETEEWLQLCRTAEAVIGPTGSSLLPLPPLSAVSGSYQLPFRMPTSDMTFAFSRGGDCQRTADGDIISSAQSRDQYQFPGFCSGCRRSAGCTFCYGCERDSEPHYHQDKTARTGGGFTYFKRDRPINAISQNNPLNWRVMLNYGPYVFYDDLEVPDMQKYGIAIGVERMTKIQEEGQDGDLRPFLPPLLSADQRPFTTTPLSMRTGADDEEEEVEEEVADLIETGDDDGKKREDIDSGKELSDTESSVETPGEVTGDTPPQTVDDETPSDETSADAATKRRLYKADQVVSEKPVKSAAAVRKRKVKSAELSVPKAFQLKQRERKQTVSSSPFSSNRQLDLPNYGNFEIHKSDKPLTEFVDFERGDDSWQTPDAFALKDRVETDDRGRRATSHPTPPEASPPQESPAQPEPVAKESPSPDVKPTPSPKATKEKKKKSSVKQPKPHKEKSPDRMHDRVRIRTPSPAPSHTEPPASVEEAVVKDQHDKASTKSATSSNQQRPRSASSQPSSIEISELTQDLPVATDDDDDQEAEPLPISAPVVGPRPPGQPHLQPAKPHRRVKAREPVMKEKKESVKRVKQKITDQPIAEVPDKQPTPEPEDIPLTPPPEFVPMVFKDHEMPLIPPSRVVEQPPLPTACPPSLPKMMEFIEPVKPIREISVTQMEVPPPMAEPPKQRRPPPALKPKPKPRRMTRATPLLKTNGAPVQASELKSFVDPLDFLAKYCIIHPDRLPHYVRVFSKAVGEQMYRYADVPHPDGHFHDYDAADADEQPPLPADASTQQQQEQQTTDANAADDDLEPMKATLTDDERKRLRDLTVVNASMKPEIAMLGMNEGDRTVAKINYTLETLMDKYEDLKKNLDDVALERVRLIASLAREQFPQVADPNYKPKPPKGKKKKTKKSKKEDAAVTADDANQTTAPPADDQSSAAPQEPSAVPAAKPAPAFIPKRPEKLTDLDIVNRLDEKQLKTLGLNIELNQVNLKLQRLQEKLKTVDDRIEELEDEKKLLQLYARDEFQRLETAEAKTDTFLRRQSVLYQKMHPIVNVEMNVTDVEEALREINGQLLTSKEIQYIFHILKIPGRTRIDVQLFSVIAALSEKVAQVDPFIRKLINKLDFEALNVKMDKSKELFFLLSEDEDDVPLGKIAAKMLAVELAAGGVTPEHTQYVLSKFNRENKGIVDFLDYLTYVPLFIEIHDRILNAPLQLERDW